MSSECEALFKSIKQLYMKIQFKYIDKLTKKYGLLHYTGNGVAEDLHEDHGIISESDNSRELELLGTKLFQALNTDAAIISTWTGDKFKVIIRP